MTLLSVFLLGLLGGLHCAGMCGGIVAALSFRGESRRRAASPPLTVDIPGIEPGLARADGAVAIVAPVQWYTTHSDAGPSTQDRRRAGPLVSRRPAPDPSAETIATPLVRSLAVNSGRLFTYTMLGAVAGSVGSTLWLLENALPVQRALFVATNLVLIAIGAWLLGARALLDWTERGGQRLWRHLQPLASRLLGARHPAELFLAGAIWGFVPCGMVYMVLLSALGAGSAANGALLMAAFGLGTLPNLVLMGLGGDWLSRFIARPSIRAAVAVAIIGAGMLGVVRGVTFEPIDIFGLCITPISSNSP